MRYINDTPTQKWSSRVADNAQQLVESCNMRAYVANDEGLVTNGY